MGRRLTSTHGTVPSTTSRAGRPLESTSATTTVEDAPAQLSVRVATVPLVKGPRPPSPVGAEARPLRQRDPAIAPEERIFGRGVDGQPHREQARHHPSAEIARQLERNVEATTDVP